MSRMAPEVLQPGTGYNFKWVLFLLFVVFIEVFKASINVERISPMSSCMHTQKLTIFFKFFFFLFCVLDMQLISQETKLQLKGNLLYYFLRF